MDGRASFYIWDMDAAYDFDDELEVLEMKTCVGRPVKDPDDPWLSRCFWDADLAEVGNERRW